MLSLDRFLFAFMVFSSGINKTKDIYFKYERYITPAAFFAGFIWDNLTLRRIDLLFENLTFIWNLLIVGVGIILINGYEAGLIRWRFADRFLKFAPLLMQFSFGGLFSAFFVFYSRSASVFSSWPFLLFLLVLFVGNDFFRKRYLRLTFQLSVFFIALFSYSVFALPVLFGKMGAVVFIASGIVSLLVIGGVIFLLWKIVPEKVKKSQHALVFCIGGIFFAFQFSYFANVIPPIPLSLKESGIYHSVERISNDSYIYKVSYERAPWYLFFEDQSSVFHLEPDSKVYIYSAIFAPTKIETLILHRWLYFDAEKKDWIEMSRVPFSISGGRDGGYRGYTYKSSVKPGKWRVEVINDRGQVLGHRTFKVVEDDLIGELATEYK